MRSCKIRVCKRDAVRVQKARVEAGGTFVRAGTRKRRISTADGRQGDSIRANRVCSQLDHCRLMCAQ